MKDKFDEAKRKLAENEMSSKDVEALNKKVEKTIVSLVKRGNVTPLEEGLKGVENIKTGDYTDESYNKLQIAIKNANATIAQGANASYDEVEIEMNASAQAKGELVKKSLIEQIKDNNVETGNQSNTNTLLGIVAIAAIVIAVLIIYKKCNKKSSIKR